MKISLLFSWCGIVHQLPSLTDAPHIMIQVLKQLGFEVAYTKAGSNNRFLSESNGSHNDSLIPSHTGEGAVVRSAYILSTTSTSSMFHFGTMAPLKDKKFVQNDFKLCPRPK